MSQYAFTIQIIDPKDLNETPETYAFTHSPISKHDLKLVSNYIESMTQKGRILKIRIGVLKDNNKVTSLMMNTKKLTSTNVIDFLNLRVTDQETLRYLNATEEAPITQETKIEEQTKTVEIQEDTAQEDTQLINESNEQVLVTEVVQNNQTNENTMVKEPVSPEMPKQQTLGNTQSFPKRKTNKFIVPVVAAISIISIASMGASIVQMSQNKSKSEQIVQLEKQLTELESVKVVAEQTPKIDVFSRYFLSTFFIDNIDKVNYHQKLKKYTSNDLDDWEVLGKTLKSNMMYEIKPSTKKNVYEVTYIVSYDTPEMKGIIEKLNFLVKSTNKGQTVVSKPVFKEYNLGE